MKLAKACISSNVDPQTSHPPSSTLTNAVTFGKICNAPNSQWCKGKYDWMEVRDGVPHARKISIFRVVISLLIDKQDIKCILHSNAQGVHNSLLEICLCYPRLINHPSMCTGIIKNKYGQNVLGASHPFNLCLDTKFRLRRDEDGNIYDSFFIDYDRKEQKPSFYPLVGKNLSGFDLLEGEMTKPSGRVGRFSLLQILNEERDFTKKELVSTINCGNVDTPAPPAPPVPPTTGSNPYAGQPPIHTSNFLVPPHLFMSQQYLFPPTTPHQSAPPPPPAPAPAMFSSFSNALPALPLQFQSYPTALPASTASALFYHQYTLAQPSVPAAAPAPVPPAAASAHKQPFASFGGPGQNSTASAHPFPDNELHMPPGSSHKEIMKKMYNMVMQHHQAPHYASPPRQSAQMQNSFHDPMNM